MSSRIASRGTAALTALTLLTTACSGAGGDTEPDADSPSRTTLEIASGALPEDLVPYQQTSIGEYLEAINIPLLNLDDKNEIFSDLLDSWETAPDALSVTLTLKPDLEWSDGEPITSGDVVMSLTQYLDPNVSLWASRIGGVVGQSEFADGRAQSISGIAAPDERTVTVAFEQPNSAWLPSLGYLAKFMPVLPEHILGEVAHDQLLDHEYFTTYPVSSGPYKIVENRPGEYLELERNPNWSLGEAGFERIFFKLVAPEVQSAQLEAEEVQLASVQSTDVERVGSIDGVEVQTTAGAAPESWWLMSDEPILDPRVRQAMLYAVDRQAICDQVLQGHCIVPTSNIRQLAPEWTIPTEDVIEYEYDPDRARELLDEAGWDPNTKLTFHNLDPGGITTTALEIAQANMADVGINWTIVDSDAATTFDSIAANGGDELQGLLVGGGNFVVDPSKVQVYADCDAFHPNGSNFTFYCDPELDALWDRGRQATDQDERAQIYQEAFRILNENPMEILLYVQDEIIAHDSRLKGVKVHPSGGTYWNIGEWHWEE